MARLVEQHYRGLYVYAYRLTGSVSDAEDLTQQTFLQAQKNLGQLRSQERAQGWLFAIARNAYFKQKRRPLPVYLPEIESTADLACTPDNVLPGEIDPEHLQQALDDLPEEFRIPLVLFYFEECSYREIAKQMDVPLGTVMSRLARAKAHLRSRLFVDSQARKRPLVSRGTQHAV